MKSLHRFVPGFTSAEAARTIAVFAATWVRKTDEDPDREAAVMQLGRGAIYRRKRKDGWGIYDDFVYTAVVGDVRVYRGSELGRAQDAVL